MPGYSWSIPASKCLIGGQLQQVEGTVCNVCYAMRHRYRLKKVKEAMERRLNAYNRDPKEWVGNMANLLALLWWLQDENGKAIDTPPTNVCRHFRWFDSGDLQSPEMLASIFDVAWCVPEGKFWLSTREVQMVAKALEEYSTPANVVIRISANKIGAVVKLNRKHFADYHQITTSAVNVPIGWQCPAHKQDGKCGECRACWSPDVPLVSYKQH